MNQEAFQAGKEAYVKEDYATAIARLKSAKTPGEVNGALNHMLGNAYMRLRMFNEATLAYQDALADETYNKRGAIYANYGRALAGTGHTDEAIAALEAAVSDPIYDGHYKAQVLLGKIFEKQGKIREAGAQYRNAAIDENNPDPSVSLLALGRCFMNLGRPIDAIEAYRTALDFSTESASQAQIYADLGTAFVAANRMQEAIDAFQKASTDPTFTMNATQKAAEADAQKAVAALAKNRGGETDALLAAAGYDPLDPLGKSGEFIPSPEDTGFFEVTEAEITQQDKGDSAGKKGRKKELKRAKKAKKKKEKKRKKRHPVRVFFVTLLCLVLLCVGGGACVYCLGFGIPSQEMVVTDLFNAKSNNQNMDGYISGSVSDTQRAIIEASVPKGATVEINGIDRSMSHSTLYCTAHLNEGGSQSYKVTFARSGLGWKITAFDNTYPSVTDQSFKHVENAIDDNNSSNSDNASSDSKSSDDESASTSGTSGSDSTSSGGSSTTNKSGSNSGNTNN